MHIPHMVIHAQTIKTWVVEQECPFARIDFKPTLE